MEHKVNIKDIQINYEVIGEGKPVIVIHGYTIDHIAMTNCLEPVFYKNDGYKRIYIDLPGMGKSESAHWICNSDVMLDIVIEFIGKVIPNEKFLLVGYSYGGYLAQGVLKNMADMIDGLSLICPVIIADEEKRSVPNNVVLQKDEKLLSRLSPEMVQSLNSMMVVQTEKTYRRYNDEILDSIEVADHTFLERLQNNGYGFSFNTDAKHDKPALFILGRQDSCVGFKDAWNILDNFPRATFSVLDKAGHNLQIEQDEQFNSLVSNWIKRTEEERVCHSEVTTCNFS